MEQQLMPIRHFDFAENSCVTGRAGAALGQDQSWRLLVALRPNIRLPSARVMRMKRPLNLRGVVFGDLIGDVILAALIDN